MVAGAVLLAVLIPASLFWIWMLVDCATNEPSEGNDKLVWTLIVLFANVLGAAAYYLVRRPQRQAKAQP